jgi:hypothetical protein
VTLHLHWRKRNQHVMNQPLSTSINGKPIPDNLVGEGWDQGSRSIDGKKPLTRIAPVDASHHRLDPTSPTRGEVTSSERPDLPQLAAGD